MTLTNARSTFVVGRWKLSNPVSETYAAQARCQMYTDSAYLGYVVFLQARSCNELGFPSFFNNILFTKTFAPRKLVSYKYGTCGVVRSQAEM